jgi:hypothetical protein
MKIPRRKKNLVDFEVQTSLLRRMAIHWCLFLAMNALALYAWTFLLVGSDGVLEEHASYFAKLYFPVLVVSFALLPVFLLDASKLSNRFVGPILRVRKTLAAAASGEAVKPLRFRENDFWQSLADDLNTALKLEEPTTAQESQSPAK